MKYRIKIVYKTGNSLNSYEEIDYVGLEWNDLTVAKSNLQRIKEHYNFYKEFTSWFSNKSDEELIEENKDKDWFVQVNKLVAYEKGNKENYWAIDKKDIAKSEKAGYEIGTIISKNTAQDRLILYSDEGKKFQISVFWVGYFEELRSAKIEMDESDMEIEF